MNGSLEEMIRAALDVPSVERKLASAMLCGDSKEFFRVYQEALKTVRADAEEVEAMRAAEVREAFDAKYGEGMDLLMGLTIWAKP